MTGNSGRILTLATALSLGVVVMSAETGALTLRASVVGAASGAPLTIELVRWSTDAERAPLLTALTPPPTPPAAGADPGASAAAGPAGRAGAGGRAAAAGAAAGRAAGRGGRGGGRGGAAAAPPASPAVRLSSAVKAAPTVGFIWGDGPTGYSIKYAWRSSSPDGRERIVLVTDRRIGAHAPSWPSAFAKATADKPDEAEYTVIEIRVDGKGVGEGKASLAAGVIVDAEAKTLALDGYAAAPALLKVAR